MTMAAIGRQTPKKTTPKIVLNLGGARSRQMYSAAYDPVRSLSRLGNMWSVRSLAILIASTCSGVGPRLRAATTLSHSSSVSDLGYRILMQAGGLRPLLFPAFGLCDVGSVRPRGAGTADAHRQWPDRSGRAVAIAHVRRAWPWREQPLDPFWVVGVCWRPCARYLGPYGAVRRGARIGGGGAPGIDSLLKGRAALAPAAAAFSPSHPVPPLHPRTA